MEVNKTKVINTQRYSEIASSYRWEDPRCKNTFPVSVWAAALIDFLYNGISLSKLELKYTEMMSRVTKPSHSMYISSLLRKIQISGKQNFKSVREHFGEEELEKWITDRINAITDEHYDNSVDKAKKIIDNWREYYHNNYMSQNFDVNEKTAIDIKKETKNRGKYPWTIKTLKNTRKKIKLTMNPKFQEDQDKQNKNKEEIGNFGESYFYDALVSKYGFDKVTWMIGINKYAPYDFSVEINNKQHFFEVKSTNKSSLKFYLSRNEFEFWKKCKKENNDYSLISVKNIYLQDFKNLPNIEEIPNPNFIINNNFYGCDGKNIIITPTKFLGLI